MHALTPSTVSTPIAALPHSQDSEKAVLSCLLFDPVNALPEALSTLTTAAFYHPAHRTIFALLREMHHEGMPVELPSLVEHARAKGVLENIGGPALLAELYSSMESTVGLAHYAGILQQRQQQRAGIDLCTRALREARECTDAADVQKWTAQLLTSAMELQTQALDGSLRKGRTFTQIKETIVEREENGRERGLSTGFPWLDRHLGGARRGKVIVIAGGTSDGKSSLALQIALTFANAGASEGHAGDIFTLEMPAEEIVERAACIGAGVRSGVWHDLPMNPGEVRSLAEFMKQEEPVMVHDDVDDIAEIAARIRIAKAERNIRWVLVDYLQLCTADAGRHNREREVAMCSQIFKRLALQLDLSIIVLSQLNDEGRLRESRAIGQDADHVLYIQTTKNENERILKLTKNRGGQRNVTCRFAFEGEHFRFVERG